METSDNSTPQPETRSEYRLEVFGTAFRFARPRTPQLERYFSSVQKNLLQANLTLARELVHPDQRADFLSLCAEKPGASQQVVTAVLKDLGFLEEATDLGNS